MNLPVVKSLNRGINFETQKGGGYMKGTKSQEQTKKRSAEDWVLIARKFGEDCSKIQQDAKLSQDKKFEKQKKLANEMAKEIRDAPDLSESDKNQMVKSIENYIQEWTVVHEMLKKAEA